MQNKRNKKNIDSGKYYTLPNQFCLFFEKGAAQKLISISLSPWLDNGFKLKLRLDNGFQTEISK